MTERLALWNGSFGCGVLRTQRLRAHDRIQAKTTGNLIFPIVIVTDA